MVVALRKIGWTLLTSLICLTCFAHREPDHDAQKGVLDLRNADLFDHPVKLHGEWKFYWMHLLSHDYQTHPPPLTLLPIHVFGRILASMVGNTQPRDMPPTRSPCSCPRDGRA